MFYFIATLVCYLGVIFSSVARAEPVCTGYDEELIGSKCVIALDEISHCPGETQAAVCIEDDGSISNNLKNCSDFVQSAICITEAR